VRQAKRPVKPDSNTGKFKQEGIYLWTTKKTEKEEEYIRKKRRKKER